VRRPATARAAPAPDASRVARVATRTPEGTDNLVPTLARQTVGGRQWVKIRLAMLPNGTTAWLPRSALGGYEVVRTHLYIDRAARRLRLERRGRTVLRARIGVGQPQWPTPRGRFIVRNRLRDFGSAAYGPVAFGTSARSAVLTDWPGGGFIGIHGTDQPGLLPGAVSHGCIRLRNRDIRRLARRMPVGTPIAIR
jgi:lipoprotein-anchoring transpeptidase ErfK/SrfK